MSTDRELLARWKTGDAAAGSELFRRFFDPLYRFFVNKVHDDVEDLIQNTLTACVRYADNVANATSVRAYILTTARHELHRHLQRRRPGARIDFSVASMVDLRPGAVTVAVAAERERQLLGALRNLPIDAQLVLELHYWEDLTAAELAEVIEVPVGTAKTRLRRAKQLLEVALRRGKQTTQSDALDRWVRSMRARVTAKPG